MEKLTVYWDGKSLSTFFAEDPDGNRVPRIQELTVLFEVGEDFAHGYMTRVLQNPDGTTYVEKTENEGWQPVWKTEDVSHIEMIVESVEQLQARFDNGAILAEAEFDAYGPRSAD